MKKDLIFLSHHPTPLSKEREQTDSPWKKKKRYGIDK
jgi:hypothetical protein